MLKYHMNIYHNISRNPEDFLELLRNNFDYTSIGSCCIYRMKKKTIFFVHLAENEHIWYSYPDVFSVVFKSMQLL